MLSVTLFLLRDCFQHTPLTNRITAIRRFDLDDFRTEFGKHA